MLKRLRKRPTLTDTVNELLRERYKKGVSTEPLSSKTTATPLVFAGDTSEKFYIWWGGHYIPLSWATGHFLTIGTTGSGKSLLTNIALSTALKSIKPGSDRRVVIFDTKGDVLGILEALGVPYSLMNISDSRAVAWDIARDCQRYDKAEELSHIFFPAQKNTDSFWLNGARAIISGIMMAFIHQHGAEWDLHDVYNAATSDIITLTKVLEGYPRNRDLINTILQTAAEKTRDGIKMQLFTELVRLRPAAAHSQHAREKISLEEFLHSEGVLVISQDLEARELSNPIIRAMFRRLVDLIVASEDSETRRTFIFLDEARFIGKLPGLLELVTFSRSKGGCVWLSTQGVKGFYDVYGENVTDEIFENCNFTTVLRVKNPTAKWASSLFGTVEVWETVPGSSYGHGGVSVSANKQRIKREVFLDSDFLQLRRPNKERGLTGFFLSPETDGYKEHIPGDVLEKLKPKSKDVPKQITKPKELTILHPWTEAEKAKFVGNKQASVIPCEEQPMISPQWVQEMSDGMFDILEDVVTEMIERVQQMSIKK